MAGRVLTWALVCAATASSSRPTTPPLGDRIPGQRLQQGSSPIDKRVNWFISDSVTALPATTDYLLKTNREITQGVYFCCGGLSFNASTGEPSSVHTPIPPQLDCTANFG